MAKEEAKKPVAAKPAVSEPGTRDRVTTVNFSIKIDKGMKVKWPFLMLALLLFLFACFMLAKANFSFSDVFDFNRIENNLGKLYSVSFVLFMLLLSLSIALAALYGYNLNPQTVLLSMGALVVPFGVVAVFYPRYSLAFLALVFPVMLAGYFMSMSEKLNLTSLYNAISKALFVFLLLTVAFTYLKVQNDKDVYFDAFMGNVVKLAPSLQGQLQGSLADAIENLPLNETGLDNLTGGTGGSSAPISAASLVTKDQVATVVAKNFDAFRTIMLNGFTVSAEKDYAATKLPKYAQLSQASKDQLVNGVYNDITSAMVPAGDTGSGGQAASAADLWNSIRKKLADQVRNAPPQTVNESDLAALKKKLLTIPVFATFYNTFEIFMAAIVLSLVSVLNWVLKIASAGFAVLLARMFA